MIEIKNLCKQFQNETEIEYKDIVFETGKSYMLLGASGCGKSTLLKAFNRMNDLVSNCKISGEVFIDNENILVNGNVAKASYIVKLDDKIEVLSMEDEDVLIVPEDIPLDIIYEDEYLLVVNKPSGMVVHPGNGNYNHTLVNALMYHCNNNLSLVNGNVRPGIVHRIDADTSGLLLVAKNDMVHNDLAKQISEKSVVRKYVCLVHGVINEDTATIDAPIGRDKNNRKKMCVTGDNSKDAVTHIRVMER